MAGSDADDKATLIKVGLEDPFVRGIAGIVVVATAASIAISLLGDGLKAVLAIALSIVFGVILVVLRVLTRNADDPFVKMLSQIVSGAIAIVFVLLVFLVVPAVTFCWPQAYHDTLGLQACGAIASPPSRTDTAFRARPYLGSGIVMNPDNAKYTLLVFYRPSRRSDAEGVVGAFLSAGYKSAGQETDLNEVATDDRSPDITLVKTSVPAQGLTPEVVRIAKLVLPLVADRVRTMQGPVAFAHGDVQVDLF